MSKSKSEAHRAKVIAEELAKLEAAIGPLRGVACRCKTHQVRPHQNLPGEWERAYPAAAPPAPNLHGVTRACYVRVALALLSAARWRVALGGELSVVRAEFTHLRNRAEQLHEQLKVAWIYNPELRQNVSVSA